MQPLEKIFEKNGKTLYSIRILTFTGLRHRGLPAKFTAVSPDNFPEPSKEKTKEFVAANYQRFKNLFNSKHEKKPKHIKGLDGLYSLKRLSEAV